jgi:transposase-like protein
LHKPRINLADHLPDKEQAWVNAKLEKAFSHPDPEQGLSNAKRLAGQLDANYPKRGRVAARRREEMFTVARWHRRPTGQVPYHQHPRSSR